MLPMLNVAGQSPVAQAAAPPSSFGGGGSGPSRPSAFDGVLSAKYAAHGNSGTQATVDRSTGSGEVQHPPARKPLHPDANPGSGAPSATAVAVPVQTPAAGTSAQPAQSADSTGGASPKAGAASSSATGAAALTELSILTSAIAPGDATPSPSSASTIAGAAPQGTGSPNPNAEAFAPADSTRSSDAKRTQTADAPSNTNLPAPGGQAGLQVSPMVAADMPLQRPQLVAFQPPVASAMLDGKTASQAAEGISLASSSASASTNPSSIKPTPGTSVDPAAAMSTATAAQNSQQLQGDARIAPVAIETNAPAPPGTIQLKFLSVPPAAATDSSPLGSTGITRGSAQIAAAVAAKQVAAAAPSSGANTNHAGAGGQNSNPKNSNSNSAAVAQAAGLAQASGGGPLHAPADAPPQAPAPAGPAAAAPGAPPSAPASANASITGRPALLPAAAPSSLNDVVQASQLYQHVGGGEMHIAMSTDLLGAVDVHAVVRQSTVTATIGVQRPDVQTLLANDLPALQHALSEHSLHVEQISVLSGSAGNQTDSGRQSPQNQQSWRGPFPGSRGIDRDSDSRAVQLATTAASIAAEPASYEAGQLSIHV